MTDRSITECYFSNPTEIRNFVTPNSLNNNIENNDYLIHNVREEEEIFNSNTGQKNLICFANTPLLNKSLDTYDSNSNYDVTNQNIVRSESIYANKNKDNKFLSHTDIISRDSTYGFPEEYLNQDSFSQTENIFNEKQPFGEEDSISFNDYSLLRESQGSFSAFNNNVSNIMEKHEFNDDPSLKMTLFEETVHLHESRSNPDVLDLKDTSNYSKDTINSQLILNKSFQHLDENGCNEVKPYLYDHYQTDVSSRFSTPYKEIKPIKALGLRQYNSKSLQDISKLFNCNVKRNELKKPHVIAGDNFEMKANLIRSIESQKHSAETFNDGKKTFIGNQRNFNANNSDNLEIVKSECISLPAKGNSLNKAKSISLHSLQGIKKSDYSHIQSKVKLYIQNLKQKNKEKKIRETKSLPTTPLKDAENLENGSTILVDEKLFENLTCTKNLKDDVLPENLRILKSKLLNSKEYLNQRVGTDIFEVLFEQVKNERHQRFQQDITLHKLQLDYDNLLARYAQAENIIDKLRIFNGSSKMSTRNKTDCINYVSGVHETFTNPSCASSPKFKKYHLRKALSTSNIFHDTISPGSDFLQGPLVKYSSSPIVDPNVSITIHMNQEFSEISMNSKTKSISLDKINNPRTSLPIYSYNENGVNVSSMWMKKYEAFTKKLREFAMLEGNSALGPVERDGIWNYLIKLCNELLKDPLSLPPSLNWEQKMQNLLEGIIYISSKFSLSTNQLLAKDIIAPNSSISALKNDDFKNFQHTVSINQSITQRRKSLESSTFLSICDKSVFDNKHFEESPLELESNRENHNGSFIESSQNLNNPNLVTSCSPSGFQLSENVCSKQNNEKYLSETGISVFKHDSKKNICNTSWKEKLSQYKAKDNDSGCPLSDRSTRNSPTFSLTNHKTNSIENLGKKFENWSSRNYYSLSSTPRNASKYSNLVTNSGNDTKYNDTSWLSGYDASLSSADESSFVYNPVQNKFKTQTSKHQKVCLQNVTKRRHEKYEDKYVSGYQSSASEQDIAPLHSCRLGTKNNISPIIQLEKKSSLLKSQLDGLKVKHWKQSHCKDATISTSRSRPIKPICESLNIVNKYDQLTDNVGLQEHKEKINESDDDIAFICHRVIPQRNEKSLSPKRKVTCKTEAFTKQNVNIATSRSSSLSINSSMQKKSNLKKTRSLNSAEFKFNPLVDTSKSVSSISQPIIYIEQFNCCGNNPKSYCKCKDYESKNSHFTDASLSKAIKLNKHRSILGSLNEATSLAEKIQQTSVTLLEHIREDSLYK